MSRHIFLTMCLVAAPHVAHAGGFLPAEPSTWLGHLETAEGPADGTISVVAEVVTATGQVVGQLNDDVVVVDGDFVLELLVPRAGQPLFLAVTINGSPLEPNLPLTTTWPAAFTATTTPLADVADDANAVGGIATPLSRARLASGAVEVPFAVITGFPPAFADGDQGLAFTAGSTLDFSAGTIGIRAASLPGTALAGAPQATDLADGTIGTADLGVGGVAASDLSALPLTKVAAGTLTGRHFAGTPFQVFEVTEANCTGDFVGKITESPTCSFEGTTTCTGVIGGNQFTGHRPCAALNRPTECFVGSSSSCPNLAAGVLVLR